MKGMPASRLMLAVCFVAGAAGLASTAHAQSNPPEDWRYRATIYGWFPGISGTTEFPSGAGGPSIDVNADTLISHLKMAFMGTFEARHGRWGGAVDWVYSDVGGDKAQTRDFAIHGEPLPGGLTSNLSLSTKTNIVTLAATYSFIERPDYSTGLVFGARMLDMDQNLNWSLSTAVPGVGVAGRSHASSTNWDAIIGVRGRARFGDGLHWFVPYYADLGGGNSKFTWQAILGAGYSFSWGDLIVAWRYIDYDLKSGEPIQSITFNGVAAGVSFSF
jgi:hypothetical protein